jgi:hypothetical protein
MHNVAHDDKPVAPISGYLALRVPDFSHPREVLADRDLDPLEKRALLAAWASDASAVESRPEFRWLGGTPGPVALTQILAALRALDTETEWESAMIAATARGPHMRHTS